MVFCVDALVSSCMTLWLLVFTNEHIFFDLLVFKWRIKEKSREKFV